MAWYRCGGGGLPAGLQSDMDTVLNKKLGTSTTYPPTDWPDTVNLMGPLPEKTASGAIANITDGADGVPLKNWQVTLPASLDGYTEVNGVKAGKNLIKLSVDAASSAQRCSVTYTSSGAEVTAEGTYARSGCLFVVKTGVTYTISFTGNSTGDYNRVVLNDKEGWSSPFKYLNLTSTEAQYTWTFTASTDILFFGMYVTGGGTTGTMTISNLQLEVNSSSSTYTAYEAPTTYTASLGRTIYGGTADIVTGECEDDYAKGSMSSTYLSGLTSSYIGYEASLAYFGGHPSVWVRNWNYQTAKERTAGGIGAVCNHFPISFNNTDIFASQYRIYFDVDGKNISSVADFIAFVQNLEANNESLDIAYELATPEAFTFTPITPTPETALGVNNFWADEGDSDVTYRADISLALQALGGGGRGLMMMRPTEPEETEETEETEGLEDELNR